MYPTKYLLNHLLKSKSIIHYKSIYPHKDKPLTVVREIMLKKIVFLSVWSILTTISPAASIAWGPVTPVADANDVSTQGSTLEAFNAGATGAATVTVNGVTFTGISTLLDQNSSADLFNGSTGDAGYDTLLSNVDFGDGTNLVTLTTGNNLLQIGTPYQIQVWFSDTRQTSPGRTTPVGDGLGNTTDLTSNPATYATGIFVADGPTQALTLASPGFNQAHITAYQIRTLPLTPPSPDIPNNLLASAGDGEITLNWEENNQFGFSNYLLRRSTNSGGPYTDIASPTVNTFTDTNLTNGITYYYVVAAQNTIPEVSNNSEEASATPVIFVPDAPEIPSGLNAIAGNDAVILNWDDNDQIGFLEFSVQRATSSGGPYTQIGTTSNSAFTDNSAINGTTYYYVISAFNTDNIESPISSEASATPSVNATPPNFVFIITDDQDFYSIGAYRNLEPVELDENGNPYVIDTPNIDRLANEGMIFHQARHMGSRVGAVCVGTRTSIMSGRNVWENNTVSGANTFPGIFNVGDRNGATNRPYATYRTSKNGNSFNTANVQFAVRNDATRRGNTDNNGSEWHADRALEHIALWEANERPNGTPFFMNFGFSHPHDERNARETPPLTTRYGSINTRAPSSLTTINPASPPLPISFLSATPDTFPAHPFDNSHLTVRDEVSVFGVERYRTEEVVRNEIGRNFACVDWIDQQVGRVLARLEDPNNDGDTSDSVIDNTYIVFTSDHGIAIGRHGLMGKQNLYEHSLRVPYIVRGPGIEPGSRSDALIYLHDTFPTFCDLAGIDIPATIDNNDGQSFRAVLEGDSTTHRDQLYASYSGGGQPGIRSVTDGRFKLIRYDTAGNSSQVTQMFDLQTNPFELLPEHGVPNIANEPAYAALRTQLEASMMDERLLNNDAAAFLGDRTLLRFEDGIAGESPSIHLDSFAFTNDASAQGPSNDDLPTLSADVPFDTDFVFGDANTLSLDFEQDAQHHLEIENNNRAINFGNAPFTIEAWVKLESLPTTNNLSSAMPVVQKKVIGASDSDLDYMFLAAAGNYGSSTTFNRLALHVGNGGAITSTLAIPDTEWHYISVALDPVSDTIRFTLDDQVDVLSSNNTGITNGGPVIVGAHFNSSSAIDSAFDGCIDELSITDGFLALNELQPLAAVNEVTDFQISDQLFDTQNSFFNLTFESDDTRLYSIQRSSTLLPSDWVDIDEYTFIQGDSGTATTTTPNLPLNPVNEQEFFRVVIEN